MQLVVRFEHARCVGEDNLHVFFVEDSHDSVSRGLRFERGDGDSLFHEEVHQRGFPDVGISDDVDKTGFVLLICHVVWW